MTRISDQTKSLLSETSTLKRQSCSPLATVWVWLGFAGVLLVLSKREIIAYSSDPSVAIDMALGYLEGISPPVYFPGVALFIKMIGCFGIPFRLAQTTLVYFALIKCTYTALDAFTSHHLRNLISAALSFFFSLDPIFVVNGDMTANHLFSGLVTILFICFWVRSVKSDPENDFPYYAVTAVLFSFFVAISRPDWQTVEISLTLSTLLIIWADRRLFKTAVLMCALSIAFMQFSDLSIKHFNKKNYAIQGQANYLDKRYSDLFATIAALPSTQPTDRYFLSDSPRRELAYRLSPTLAGVRSNIESKTGNGAIAFDASLKHFGKYDISNAFFYWHLNNVMNLSNPDGFNILGIAAKEIQRSAKEQGIPLNYPIVGVVSRDANLWLRFLPSSIRRIYLYSFEEVSYKQQNPRNEDLSLISRYNLATLRRTALVRNPEGNDVDYPLLRSIYHVVLNFTPWAMLPAGSLHAFLIFRRGNLRTSDLLWIVLTALFITRVAYYALLDASFYSAATWYLVPNHLMWIVMLICNISAGCHLIKSHLMLRLESADT